ncbi:MAG: hypothetical protein BM564_00390 [Bacteroidetes bacterium MedPE-SWsnd-G2]|nr:MAG: hypothetical protein BM564_00390 [Bacteroidetes bacterium MedPE-SWsnd-G2]
MSTNRPKIIIPLQTIDILVELTTFSLLLFSWGYSWSNYSTLPDTIPTHFNASGIADDFGDKSTIWILPILFLTTYLLLFIVNRFPEYHNYMVKITTENAYRNYKFSTQTLRLINLFCAVLFAYINYFTIQYALQSQQQLGQWFLPTVIAFTVLLPIFLFFRSKHINSKQHG